MLAHDRPTALKAIEEPLLRKALSEIKHATVT
jgi:hypothetical protein